MDVFKLVALHPFDEMKDALDLKSKSGFNGSYYRIGGTRLPPTALPNRARAVEVTRLP